ncbi:MAG TPA: hypothetical protein VNN22_14685 [Verrucomicrobiae bacterium]|nr:hypothetical protein [Verrucomicrobiae bacterium]
MKKNIQCASWTSEKFTPELTCLFPKINPGRTHSGQQANSKFMKNKPNRITDVRHLSVDTERTVFNGHIHQTLKSVEGNVTAHETARPADARFARREYSVVQPATGQREACFRCPHRLSHGRFCGG